MDYFILGVIGVILGLIGSLLGVGVGILGLLVFVYYINDPSQDSFETVRVIFANNALFTGILFGLLTLRYSKQSGLSTGQLIKLTLFSIPTSGFITWSIVQFDWISLPIFYVLFCLSIGAIIYTLITHKESSFLVDCQRSGQEKTSKLLTVGALSGLFQGLIASESSTILVPYLNRFCDLKIEKAISIATASIAITLTAVGIAYMVFIDSNSVELMQWRLLIPLWLGAMVGVFLPFGALSRIGLQLASYILSFFLFIVALRLLFFEVLSLGV